MKASFNWIKELFAELKASPASIEQKLTAVGIEVEDVHRQADAYAEVVSAEVRCVEPHPNAEKLRLATVFDGERELRVVCGASNVEVGQKVALARLGATLPNGVTIERRAIRGIESDGMICSAGELGLVDASDGIMVLPSRTRAGKSIAQVLGRTDVVFEVAATPNRPDVLSHLGLARELAAIYRLNLPRPKVKLREAGEPASTRIKIDIKAAQRSSRYVARVIEGVCVGPSPDWVVRRLESVGLRSISNVVDATNLALLEFGHPLHAFDLDKIEGRRIVVRTAKEGEVLKTLDGTDRKLDPDDLVIADASSALALAGVMGGANSEVGSATTSVLLEAAIFDPKSVRRTSKRHGLHTEASHRFERGTDPAALDLGIDRCAELILELAGGRVLGGRVEAVKREQKTVVVPIRPARASLVLGRVVDPKEVRETLTALGLKKVTAPEQKERLPRGEKAKKKKGPPPDSMFFAVPSWRVDLEREEDLIEEVARMSGYDSIPTLMPSLSCEPWTKVTAPDPRARARCALVAEGYLEMISLAFTSQASLEAFGVEPVRAVRLQNPLGEETAWMRTSMLPSLLRSARHNQSLSRTDMRMFEIGRTFEWALPPGELPRETERIGIVLRGLREPRGWASSRALADVYDLKGSVEGLLAAFRVRGADWVPADAAGTPWLHPRSATRIEAAGRVLGILGELHPKAAEAFDLTGAPVFVAELELEALAAVEGSEPVFKALPRYPAIARDLSFFIDRTVSARDILRTVTEAARGELLENADVFDVFEGKGLPENARSVAVGMTFRAADRTLTDTEVDTAQAAIMQALEGRLGASIRKGAD